MLDITNRNKLSFADGEGGRKDTARAIVLNGDRYYFDKKSCIGEGSSSRVYCSQRVTSRGDISMVAVKKVYFDVSNKLDRPKDGASLRDFQREVRIFKQFRRSDVYDAATYASFRHGDCDIKRGYIMQRMESCNASTFWHGLNDTEKSEQFRVIVTQMGKEIKTLHDRGVVHNDIKLDNFFVRPTISGFRLVLGDFGLSFDPKDDDPIANANWYSSPESLTQTPTLASDIFSFGIVAMQLLSRIHPFTNASTLFQDISEETLPRRQNVYRTFEKIRCGMLMRNIDELMLSCWMKAKVTRMKQFFLLTLCERPLDRCSIDEALELIPEPGNHERGRTFLGGLKLRLSGLNSTDKEQLAAITATSKLEEKI